MALKLTKPDFLPDAVKRTGNRQTAVKLDPDHPGSFDLADQIPADTLFGQLNSQPVTDAPQPTGQMALCEHCKQVHELKQTLWLVENARLVEISVSGFFFCAEMNKVFMSGE